jgi:hypothetical protein
VKAAAAAEGESLAGSGYLVEAAAVLVNLKLGWMPWQLWLARRLAAAMMAFQGT